MVQLSLAGFNGALALSGRTMGRTTFLPSQSIMLCTVPSHINYQKEVAGFYNLYEPITHIPVEGDFKHIRSLVEHILVSSMSWEWTIFNCYT